MDLVGKKLLEKLKRKNLGNKLLGDSIEALVHDIENSSWSNKLELRNARPDADNITDNYYFFNINIHRAFILFEFEDGEATVVWCGTHDEYETTFKNNKNTAKKWLKDKGHI